MTEKRTALAKLKRVNAIILKAKGHSQKRLARLSSHYNKLVYSDRFCNVRASEPRPKKWFDKDFSAYFFDNDFEYTLLDSLNRSN